MKIMTKNKYYNRFHISKTKFRQLIKCFSMNLNANETSQLVNISHISYKKIFFKLRIYIFKNLLCNKVSLKEFELGEKAKLLSAYFKAKKRGIIVKAIMSTAEKIPVFGLLKRDGNIVYRCYNTTI